MAVICQKCGVGIKSYSPMRKWCVDCRREIANERLKSRNKQNRELMRNQ